MAHLCCFADIRADEVALLRSVLLEIGEAAPDTIARLNIIELSLLAPGLLVCDIDGCRSDPLEMLRQLRFVLPTCIVAVYTTFTRRSWALECHLAGANCVLSKEASKEQLVAGLRAGVTDGCYTDPRFAAA